MAASRHTSPPLAILAVAFTVLGFILIYTFSQIYGNLLADQVTDFVAARLGMSAARMTAQFAPIVVPGGLAAMCLWAAFLVAVWYVRHTELPQGQMSPQELSLKEREVAAAEANADALQRQARQLEWQHDPWLQAIRESGSRVSLSLVWRRNGLQLCVHNDGPDAVFEANVDLSDAGVQSDRRGKYAAVWADDPDADRKKIFEGADEYIALYGYEISGVVYSDFFCVQTGDPFGGRKHIRGVYSWCPTSDPPVPPRRHVLGVSITATPRMKGGAKHGQIEIIGEGVKVLSGDIKEPQ